MTDTAAQPPKALPLHVYPPERIEVDEFQLRRYTIDDAEALHQAVKASYAEIHPWMPWCVEPVKPEDQRDFIERAFLSWTTGKAFNWGIFDGDGKPDGDGKLIGAISLMDRVGSGALEIGYWLRTDRTGRGIITRAAARLTEIGLGLPEISRIEIHCDEANVRSAAVPKRLGYRLEAVVEGLTQEAPGETGRGMVWVTP